MSAISFIDTSVLCNLVPVPGFDQQREKVLQEMAERLDGGEEFILPITSVIETGNHIAQLSSGGVRREAASKLDTLLRFICDGQAPWVLHDVAWDRDFLRQLLDGAGTGTSYIEHATVKVGAGDLCILTEREMFRARSRIPAGIWTLDGGLSAHA
ncbi:hypothetical protein EDF42_1873 [Curtobacterium sp. PhB172]|uniref:hypothetical protein n=1 Tax=Curtobacterium sp. PhB172 TaxID=2485196 RepID=UPI000FB7F4C2|nr:hypothetical protein [Curtobacterium sp. PhB172]ROS65449.1 hypothetical protein EDF42_1873 [Curtobacterium sp. PhB172]